MKSAILILLSLRYSHSAVAVANEDDLRFMSLLVVYPLGYTSPYYCTATVISPLLALTARGCLLKQGLDIPTYRVTLRLSVRSKQQITSSEPRGVKRVVLLSGSNRSPEDQLALIHLEKGVPICFKHVPYIVPQLMDQQLADVSNCRLYDYSHIESDGYVSSYRVDHFVHYSGQLGVHIGGAKRIVSSKQPLQNAFGTRCLVLFRRCFEESAGAPIICDKFNGATRNATLIGVLGSYDCQLGNDCDTNPFNRFEKISDVLPEIVSYAKKNEMYFDFQRAQSACRHMKPSVPAANWPTK